jgi:hypothetical protein
MHCASVADFCVPLTFGDLVRHVILHPPRLKIRYRLLTTRSVVAKHQMAIQ